MSLQTDGYLILPEALSFSFVEQLRAAHEAAITSETTVQGRRRAFLKMAGPFSDRRLLANGQVLSVLTGALGSMYCSSLSSDTALPGSVYQAPHRDIGFPTGVHVLIVNVSLQTITEQSGPMEVWPGTHRLTRDDLPRDAMTQDGYNPEMEEFVKELPPRKLTLGFGDVLIRDPALLHRGTPNRTTQPRIHLTMSYVRHGKTYGYGKPELNYSKAEFEAMTAEVQELLRIAA